MKVWHGWEIGTEVECESSPTLYEYESWHETRFYIVDDVDANKAKDTARIQELEEGNKELLDGLCDVINQSCGMDDGTLDSMALSAYADGMHILNKYGRLKITKEAFRRVIGEWVVPEIAGK